MRKAPRRRGEAWRADGCMREAVARLFPLKAEGDQAKGDADVKWVVAPIKPVCGPSLSRRGRSKGLKRLVDLLRGIKSDQDVSVRYMYSLDRRVDGICC